MKTEDVLCKLTACWEEILFFTGIGFTCLEVESGGNLSRGVIMVKVSDNEVPAGTDISPHQLSNAAGGES